MATAKQPQLQPFAGETQEDVTVWTTNARFLLSLYDLDDFTSKRIVCSALRGAAFDWAREVLTRETSTTTEQLLIGLNSRFLSRMKITKTPQRLLSDGIPDSTEKFFVMIKEATYLFEHGYMSLQALSDRIISRSPSEIRIALWSLAGQSKDMFEFTKAVEKVIPLAYGREGSMNFVNSNDNNNQNNISHINFSKSHFNKGSKIKSEKVCDLHGRRGHTTEECFSLKKLKQKGWSLREPKSMNVVSKVEESEEKEINSTFYFSFKNLNNNKHCNPFLVPGSIGCEKIKLLVDTGADLTLISDKLLPSQFKIQQSSQKAKAANGLEIPIIGQVHNLLIKINNMCINVKRALVTKIKIPYILLGYPDIIHTKQLIYTILDRQMRNEYTKDVKINTVDGDKNALLSQAQEIKRRFSDIFASEINQSRLCTIKRHAINTGDRQPICQRGHRVQIHLEKQVDEEIARMKKHGIIQESKSPWRSSLVVVPKENGKIRLCVDYRALNEITIKNTYPLPRIDEIIDSLSKAEYFSIMDATAGYHQIALEEEDKKKTAFAWKGELFEFNRMPFGLCNAPATFQTIMNTVLKNENWKFAIPYLDDIIVFSITIEEHKKHLEIVL
jgi:hypothetical protein